ncbi:MAG TPA: ABC transporter substrate-binding protein, partial [Anaerolineae bacterium]|nr:ABC transporter substrate-binding protein [Anaerolineae bacterium]
RRVGCATITIKKIEGDERRPSRQMAERLAGALKVPEDEQGQFLAMGLGERAADTLPLAREPLPARGQVPPWLEGRDVTPDNGAQFVGREQEMARLHTHLEEALAGSGHAVLVAGEAGRGKTALLGAFADAALAADPGLVVARGACSAVTGLGDPYLPFRDLLASLAGDVEARWQAGVLTTEQAMRLWTLAPVTARVVAAAGPQLVDVLVPHSTIPRRPGEKQDHGEGRRDNLFEQATAVLRALAQQSPLLLLIDDLQWADRASASLLFHLARHLPGSRILLVCAYRPSEVLARPPAQSGDGAGWTLRETLLELERLFGEIEINLDTFDPVQARALSDALIDREPNDLSEAFRVKFFWQTRGHPLFAVELLCEMQARGDLVLDSARRWVESGQINWEALPTRVAAAIEQRLHRLDTGARQVLDVASIEGEFFTAAVVAAASGLDQAEVVRVLTSELGQRQGLVHERGERLVGDPRQPGAKRLARFQFRHVLFQHYLYQALSDAERRRLHARIGESMETLHRPDLDPVTAELAHHYTQAGTPDRAIEFLLRAGDRARTLYAHDEAVDYYRRALSFQQAAGDREGAARTLMKLGLVHHTAFDYAQAAKAYREAFGLWRQAEALTPAAVAPPQARHTLRLNWTTPSTLDPTLAPDLVSNALVSQLFSGLVALTPDLTVVPDIAQRWEVADGGHTYTFFLRDDARWSDGVPVTAGDFELAWKRALHPTAHSPLAGLLLRELRGAAAFAQGETDDEFQIAVTAVDDRTLVVELVRPTSYFPQLVTFPALFPVPRHVVERNPTRWASGAALVSNGPFTLAARAPGRIAMERNPGWHGRNEGNVGRIELTLDAEPEMLWRMYVSGELDVLNLWMLPPEMVNAARHYYPQEYISGPQLLTHYLMFNTRLAPFDDVRVRRAFALSTDRDHLANVTLAGALAPATGGFVPPGMPGHLPGTALAPDVAQARELLAAAGFPDGRGFPTVECLMRHGRAHLVEPLLARCRENLGIDVRARELSPLELLGHDAAGGFNLAFGYW